MPAAGNDVVVLGGRYQLLSVVGRGGMSTVYRAVDNSLGRDVAVKLFHAGAVEVGRQDAELAVLASLEHHNVVGLLDAGIATDQHGASQRFLVMPLITGQDLEQRLDVGPLAAKHIAEIGYDLAEALAYVHGRGVVHRDIKPSNVLLVDYGNQADRARAALTDFGVALADGAERLTADGATTGTAAYLSPEQAAGQPVGPATDVYALGLVLLQCFTRRREFPGSLIESAVARLTRDPLVPEPLPEGWRTVLAAMTARDPEDRPDAEALIGLLRDLVIAETTHPDAAVAVDNATEASSRAEAILPGTLNTLPEESLERTARMAARLLDAPIALIDAADEDRSWSAAYIADGVDAVAANIAFRPGVAPAPEPVLIPDGTTHPQMRTSPLVTGPLAIRCYISVPLRRRDGTPIGTLAILDTRPRTVTQDELVNLQDLAALAATQLELRHETIRTFTSDALSLPD
jgi:eukaryotic-like serine/threonine-protein kinase